MDRARVPDADDWTQKAVLTIGKLNFLRFRQLLLLVSISLVSVMSLAVSSCYLHYHYYSSEPLLLVPWNNFFYRSTFVFSFFTHTLERKYMFLLCNGILVFLAKSLCFDTNPNPEAEDPDHPVVIVEMKALAASDGIELSEAVEDAPVEEDGENAAAAADREEEEVGGGEEGEAEDQEMGSSPFMEEADGGGRESETLVMENDYDDDEDRVAVEEDEEEAEGTEAATMAASSMNGGVVDISTEELNKKIEEFIRKMKEEIRIEAQSQLIAV